MKETTPAAMPPCFERWCKRFDELWRHQAQKREFRNYIGGLLGESERKNLSQMAGNAVGVTYHRLHPWCAASEETSEAAHPLFDGSAQVIPRGKRAPKSW